MAGKFSKAVMPDQVKQRLAAGEALNIVDVREDNERESGVLLTGEKNLIIIIPIGV